MTDAWIVEGQIALAHRVAALARKYEGMEEMDDVADYALGLIQLGHYERADVSEEYLALLVANNMCNP